MDADEDTRAIAGPIAKARRTLIVSARFAAYGQVSSYNASVMGIRCRSIRKVTGPDGRDRRPDERDLVIGISFGGSPSTSCRDGERPPAGDPDGHDH
ncbi:hypothetical protein HBB16_20280 [Pseudonocardia sp. MCCB 268]|nr:hypothetical protein [Pseudonocardia cytotoxica]